MRLRRRAIAHNGKLYKLLGLVSALQYEDRELRRLQLLELRILQDIDRVCDELGITYFLDSGSVLGALRHRGFIPWDDDIDLGMPRADYERFVHEAPKLLGDEYVVSTPEINPSQAALFARFGFAELVLQQRKPFKLVLTRAFLSTFFPMMLCRGMENWRESSAVRVVFGRVYRTSIMRRA